MASESFDATDDNGNNVTGTVEVYRDPKGPYFDPTHEYYKNSRYADARFQYFNTRGACTIDPKVLSQAMQEAFATALKKFGISDPNGSKVADDVNASIEATRKQCRENADKYVSNETLSSTNWETGRAVGDLTAKAYRAVLTPAGGIQTVVARENSWPADDISARKTSDSDDRNEPILSRRVVAQDTRDNGVGSSFSSADGVDPVNLIQPTSVPLADSIPVRRLLRVNANASPVMPAVSSDGQGSSGSLFENRTSSPRGISSRNRNLPVSAQEAEIPPGSPLGIFSGKPMPRWTTPPPIFDTRDHSDAAGDQSRFTMLGGLLWGGGKSKASAGAPAVPFALDRTDSFSNGAASPESGPGAGIVPPAWAAQRPQKSPASLIMDYIQRLKPLEATPSRTSAFDTGAPPVPFVSPDGATGGLSSDPSPTPPQENPQGPLSLMDAYLEYRKQLDASPPQASAFDAGAPAAPLVPAADANLSGGLLGRLAALMGVDPSNPDQFAPPPQDDELRGYYRDDPTQPWFVPR